MVTEHTPVWSQNTHQYGHRTHIGMVTKHTPVWSQNTHWYGYRTHTGMVTEHAPLPIKRLLTRSAPLHSVHPGRQAHHQQLLLPQQVVPVSSLPVLSDVPDVLWEGNVSSGSSPACPAAPLWRYGGIHIDTIHKGSNYKLTVCVS